MIVVFNASPLINISKLRLFHHLPALYERLIIPEAVFNEVVEKGAGRPGAIEVSITGTIGILLDLKEANIITKIRPYLNKAIRFGFRISPVLYSKILQKAKE